ncbi:MAG TPA: DMT family transporter [Leucothrix mucor]|nr:DMT family transporter [Leucothrix mucor]
MKLSDALLLILLAAIWGSSFIFMRATVADFGPVFLITLRVGVASLCLLGFLFVRQRFQEFIKHWKNLLWIGLLNSALPFCLLAYASVSLSAGVVSILNAVTPIFTAFIAHLWLKDKMTRLQFVGMVISLLGVSFLVWDKISWQLESWWPILAGLAATVTYGIAANSTKKYLKGVSAMTATAGSLFFATLFMLSITLFFLPDLAAIPSLSWSYAIALAVVCTAFAYVIFFRLIQNIGPSKAVSVTFLIPIFSFTWAYLLLDEVVTNRMWIATAIILFGTALVTGLINFKKLSTK